LRSFFFVVGFGGLVVLTLGLVALRLGFEWRTNFLGLTRPLVVSLSVLGTGRPCSAVASEEASIRNSNDK